MAAPTLALPGDAEASAVDLRLSLELGGASLLDVDAAAETEGPPTEVVIPDLSAHVGALNGAAVSGRATLSTASGAAGTTSSAVIEDLAVSVLGVQAVGATRVTSAADCLPGALPAAETASEGVTVLGTPVDPAAVPAEGLELSTAATVPGMTSAEVLAKVRAGSISRNAASAEATGLTVNLTLKGTVPGVGMVAAIWLGNIVIGEAACEHLDVPAAPTAEELVPAEGASTGSDTVTLRGSGFTGDTTVDVGGNSATDVVVLSDSELTFSTPAGPVGPSLVTVTTQSGPSAGLAFTYTEPAPEVPVVEVLDPDETAATGGEEIWIFGSGFARDRTSVTVGQTVISPSDVEFLNTGTLVIKAPAQPAGLASLSVTTPVGSSGSLDLNYFPVAVPPTITSVTPDSGPMEGNTLVTLRGTGFVPAATMVTMDTASFLDDDVTVVSDTELSFIVPAGTEGPVNIDVTTAAGTSNTVVYTYTATAPPPPPAGMEGHDFNGDGTVDVLARDSAGRLWLYPGNGAAGWLPRKQVGSGWQTMTSILAPGDFDGDANADVLARDSAGRLWLYPGNGAAGWLAKKQVGSGWQSMTSIVGTGDFNGDADADVLARDSAGRLWLYPGNGAAGWLAKKQVGSGWQSMTAILGPGDFNGDGNVDVLARDSGGRLWLYPGNGAAGWLAKKQVGSGWQSMTAILGPGDFNGDGNVDVLARDSGGRLWLYPGNGSAGWLAKALVGSSWNGMTGIL